MEVAEDLTAQAFHNELTRSFPKLEDAGGFELMRCLPNSRQLEPISYSVAKSPRLLKKVIGNSRIYIRPIQKSLDTSPEIDEAVSQSPKASACFLWL